MIPRWVIAGTGRAGTTFLVRVLSRAGADTGFRCINGIWYDTCTGGIANAGFERHPRPTDGRVSWERLPMVVKDPRLSLWIDDLEESGFAFAGIVAPVRNLHDAAESRIARDLQWQPDVFGDRDVLMPDRARRNCDNEQNRSLAEVLGRLTASAVCRGIPYHLVPFWMLTQDAYATIEIIRPMLIDLDVSAEDFSVAWEKEMRIRSNGELK